jgi:hypothetical protein
MPVVLANASLKASPPATGTWKLARDWRPLVEAWSQKRPRNWATVAPLVAPFAAPVVALLGIWLVSSRVAHHTASDQTAAPAALSQSSGPALGAAAPAPEAPAPEAPLPVVAPEAAPPSPPAPAAAAGAAELARATKHGLPALEELATKYPDDAAVRIALASEQARAQRYQAAVASIDRLLTLSPGTAQGGKAMGILWRAAQSPASEEAFATLRKLGARGSDVALDLASTPGIRDAVMTHARSELSLHLAGDASSDTRTATALLLASDCSARKALLGRAESEGGKRTLALLGRFARGAACTSSADPSCNSCLTGSQELAHAREHLAAGVQP